MTQNYIERYWRDATPADAIKEPPMVARFRDEDDKEWLIGKLFGFDRSRKYKWCGETRDAIKCQVYDAPDPGEGWRLIDPEKESPEEGDEFFEHGYWKTRRAKTDPFAKTFYYRRRIEQPKPQYVPFAWEDREQLRGRIITFVYQNSTIEFRCESFSVYDDEFLVNDFCAKWLCKNAVFVDTKEPVGKKVAQ